MKNNNNILEKLDWERIYNYVEDGMLHANKHPEYDIWLIKYSKKTHAEGLWDEYTLACRGIVINKEGNILSRPFGKFKNFEEHKSEDLNWNQKFDVFEKMDGSLVTMFFYEEIGEWITTSSGSFDSYVTDEVKKMFNVDALKHMNTKCTYVFEAIFPENRIVIDYGELRDLILLGRIDISSGDELCHYELIHEYGRFFNVVSRYNIESFDDLRMLMDNNESNKEGFVIRFEDGFRIKMKYAEYVRLHAIVTNVSTLTIWRHLREGRDYSELLERVPDEFYSWVKNVVNELRTNYNNIEFRALKAYIDIVQKQGITDKKEFAFEAKKHENWGIIFAIKNGHSYEDSIWRMIRPVHKKPFEIKYDI